MNWLMYLLEANLYLTVFYLLYIALLARETYYNLNRFYLLLICCVAWVIPLTQLGFLIKPGNVDVMGAVTAINHAPIAKPDASEIPTNFKSLQDLLVYGYMAGAFAAFLVFSLKLSRLLKLIITNKGTSAGNYKIIRVEGSNKAFSFLNYVFISQKITDEDIVLRHELTHIEQKHSLDVLFLGLIMIVSWFNPFVYLLNRSLKTVHEYIADEKAAGLSSSALAYSSFLLDNAYGLTGPAITHSFFNYNLLKKRILMLNKTRSGNLARLKYLFTTPLLAGMLCTSTLAFSKTYGWIDITLAKTNAPQKIKKTDTVYSTVETLPEFPGGMDALLKYVAKNTRYPARAVKNKTEGKVIVNFIIEKDGSVTNVKPYRSVSPELDQEAVRVISSLPKWKPGAQKGKPVRTAYSIPIGFKLPPQ